MPREDLLSGQELTVGQGYQMTAEVSSRVSLEIIGLVVVLAAPLLSVDALLWALSTALGVVDGLSRV